MTSFPRLPIGGYRVVYEYANHLVNRGHKVSVIHCKNIKDLPISKNFYKLLKTEFAYLYRSIFKPKLKWQYVDPKVKMMLAPTPDEKYIPEGDIVFATAWALADYVLRYNKSKGKKCYLFQHYETWSGPKEKVDATWRAPFYKVVVSKWLYDIGISLGATNMVYIPNGLNHNVFKIYNLIKDRPQTVSMMFSNQTWKGSKDGLKALELSKEKIAELKAILFGVTKPKIKFPDWVKFYRHPTQDDLIRKIYNASSVFLWPSHFEGFSLPPAEAMACGCAVISTDCGGIHDFAENGVSALISEIKKPEDLAQNLFKLLKDDNFRIKIAEMGNKSVQKLTWEYSTDLMEKFLFDCINDKYC